MTITELINELSQLKNRYGDIEVVIPHYEITTDYSYEPQINVDKDRYDEYYIELFS